MLHLIFGLDVIHIAPADDSEQWWLGDVHMSGFDQFVHLPVKETQQQRANVRSVDVRIGHDDDLVVAPFAQILIGADTDTNCIDDALHLFVGEHFVFARLVGVDDLAAQRQDGLKLAQPASFGAAAGRIAFDQV